MSDIKQKLTSMTKNLTQASTGIVKTTKLSINLANEEENLKSIYHDIGRKVREIYMFGGSLGSFFDEKYKEVQTVSAKIEDIRNQLEIAKGTKTCPKCAKSVDRNAEFCPKCGFDMNGVVDTLPAPPAEPAKAVTAAPVENKPELKICSACNSKNDSSEKFCLSCGRML